MQVAIEWMHVLWSDPRRLKVYRYQEMKTNGESCLLLCDCRRRCINHTSWGPPHDWSDKG